MIRTVEHLVKVEEIEAKKKAKPRAEKPAEKPAEPPAAGETDAGAQ